MKIVNAMLWSWFVLFCAVHVLIVGVYGLITVAAMLLMIVGLPYLMEWNRRWWTDGPDKQEVLDVYDDAKVCGQWGVLNVDTGESKIMGNMVHRTIKVRHSDGSVGLDYEWVTEDDAKNL